HAPRARADRARPPGPEEPRHRRRARSHRGHRQSLPPCDLRQASGREPDRACPSRRQPDQPLTTAVAQNESESRGRWSIRSGITVSERPYPKIMGSIGPEIAPKRHIFLIYFAVLER